MAAKAGSRVIDASTDTLIKTIKLAAKATGFQSDGSTLDKIVVDAANPAATKVEHAGVPEPAREHRRAWQPRLPA